MTTGIQVQRLRVQRGGRPVLREGSLSIAPRKLTALLGANGAAKSALVLALADALPKVWRANFRWQGQNANFVRQNKVRQKLVLFVARRQT